MVIHFEARFVQTAQKVTKLSFLSGVLEGRCAAFSRVVCAVSLGACWMYSLALDIGSVLETSYLDIRVRFYSTCGQLINLHVLEVPLFYSVSAVLLENNKTAETLFGICQRALDSLDEQWRYKLGLKVDRQWKAIFRKFEPFLKQRVTISHTDLGGALYRDNHFFRHLYLVYYFRNLTSTYLF